MHVANMNRSAVTEDGSPALSLAAPVRSSAMEDELDLGRYIRMIFRGWPLIVVGALLGAAAGVAAANRRPILYQSGHDDLDWPVEHHRRKRHVTCPA